MRKGIHVAGMDAVFKISQTIYRDRKIRAKNSVKRIFCPYFRLAAYDLMRRGREVILYPT
mgnify:CR=1 FL=1